MRVLLVDGEWNLKRNFMKRENLIVKGEHCGGSYGFLESLRSVVNKVMPDRVVVLWDGAAGGKMRNDIYPLYKANRENKSFNEEDYTMNEAQFEFEKKRKYSKLQQKIKVKNYLEELFVRQAEIDLIEADDLIALYVLKKKQNEEIIIFSSDKDYLQLIDEQVSVLRPSDNLMITINNFKEIFGYIHQNCLLLKCFEGDESDNISGVDGIAQKTIIKYFPRFVDEIYDVDRFIKESIEHYQTKKIKVFEKLIGCRKICERNKKLMDLKNPFINKEAEEEIETIMECPIVESDLISDRSVNNAMKMMIKDGYNTVVWKNDLTLFMQPFYRLVAKEKEYSKLING